MDMRGSRPKVVGQYRTLNELGKGAYGIVFLAKHLKTGETYALKALHQIDLMGYDAQKKADAKRYLDTEIKVMREIKSEYVVRLYDVFSTRKRLYLVMDYCNGGSLTSKMQEKMNFEEAARLFRELASALISMHERSFVHRDLKPDNILIHNNTVKLGDFGLSKEVTERTCACSAVGTRLFMAPEVLQIVANAGNKMPYNVRVDYWSAGIILYQMVSGNVLFNSKNERELLDDQRRVCGDVGIIDGLNVVPECKDLLRRLIVLDPSKRISSEEFRLHPFVTGVPRLSVIDFSSLVCFTKPPVYALIASIALRIAGLLCSWAKGSPDAFIYYLKACKAVAPHVDGNQDCQTAFCRALKLADAEKPRVIEGSATVVVAEKVAEICEEVKRGTYSDREKANRLRDARLVLDLVKSYPQILAFKRRLEKAIDRLA